MKQKGIHALKIVLFIGILYGLILLLGQVFTAKNNDKESGMDFAQANGILGEPADTIDVILVGDSEVYNAISPMEMWNTQGITSYDSATGGQQIDEAYNYISQAMEVQHPKVVIIETNLLYRKLGFDNFFFTRFRNAFDLTRYHDRWKILRFRDLYEDVNYTWTDDLKGFRYFPKTDGIDPGAYMKETTEVRNFNRFCAFYLKKIRELCDENGATLMFLSTPSTKNWNTPRHNGVKKYADRYGIGYLDMNMLPIEEYAIDWSTDTKDKGDHLNYVGAVKASQYLARYLTEHYELQDHREDEKYAGWNEALERYWKIVEKDK